MMTTEAIMATDERHFEVTVWDAADGDIVETLYWASEAEMQALRDKYDDDPRYTVEIEERT